MKISAVIIVLNESEFIQACIEAIYPFVDKILIQTNYDRSWSGDMISPDDTIEKILAIPDEKGKISLRIARLPDEAIARNWLMRSDGYNINHKHKSTTSNSNHISSFCDPPDYFWVIDGDEIYDPESIPNIINFLDKNKPKVLKIRGLMYFKTWNYRVSPPDNFWQPGFIRPGTLFFRNRNMVYPWWVLFIQKLVFNKYWKIPFLHDLLFSLAGTTCLPEDIAVFHHASFVGNDARMTKKISFSVHYEKKMDDWYRDVWKKWTPQSQNLHPLFPESFKSLEYVPSSNLPKSVRDFKWPDEYIDLN